MNQDKTAIRRPVRFELLGYGFVSSFHKGEKGKYDLRVAPKSWQRLKLKIKVLTRKTSPIPLEERIQRLNSLMYGWLGYFQLGKIWGKLSALDGWIRNRLRYCIWKQWKKPNRRMRAFRKRPANPILPTPIPRQSFAPNQSNKSCAILPKRFVSS